MKRICLAALIVCPLLLGACNDLPRYEPDRVVTVAKSLSPDCQASGAMKCG